MYCGKCGAQNEPGMNFCEKCGEPLNAAVVKAPAEGDSREKRKKQLIIGGICLTVLLACIIGILVHSNSQKQAEYNEKMNVAHQYFQEMDYEKAETAYLEAIDIQPKEEDAYISLSQVYITQERYDDAIGILEKGRDNTGSQEIEEELLKLTEGDQQYQAYYDLCMEYREKYGAAGFVPQGVGSEYGDIGGFSVARLMDFNDDGNMELLLAYNDEDNTDLEISIAYEVWAWNDDQLVNVLPATGVNHGTDVSGWLSAVRIDGILCIHVSKLREIYREGFYSYDGEQFTAKCETRQDMWGEGLIENEYFIDGEAVSEDAYYDATDEVEEEEFFGTDTPYSNEDGEFRIDMRSMTSSYTDQVIAETNRIIELLKTKSSGVAAQENPYEAVLAQYRSIVQDRGNIDWDTMESSYGEDVNMEALTVMDGADPYRAYYALKDIDKNGVKELLIACGTDEENLWKYEIFTQKDNDLIRLFPDYMFGYRTNYKVYRDGIIRVDLSGGAWDYVREYYRLSDDGDAAELVEYISSVSEFSDLSSDEPNVTFYHDEANTQVISEEEFGEITDSYEAAGEMSFNWKLIE